jgi:NADH-quinone oxidoreductase subunit N
LLPFALAGFSTEVDKAAFSAIVLYILVYAVINLGAFAVVIGLSPESQNMLVNDFAGLGQRAPILGISMVLFLISLAGIPITPGFWGKFFIFSAAIDRGGVGPWLAVAMVVNSVISLVYYFYIVRAMYLQPLTEPVRRFTAPALVAAVVVLAAVAVAVIGISPPLFTTFPARSTLIFQ